MTMTRIIDFRSDTVTKPDHNMLAAMMAAEVGDDVFGEDQTVNTLEAEVATLVGTEAAMFVTSGTLANQLAMHMHCRPGDSIICEKDAHIVLYESGGGAALSGVQFDLIAWEDSFSDAAIDRAFHPEEQHAATSRLLSVENTHNRKAGSCLDVAELQRIRTKARALGLKLHCDGARLWNAAVALNKSERELTAGFDTVSVCFSKGLGAPVGSALCGSRDLVKAARKVRKRWGGGMRQAGYLAAAALYALRNNRSRLAADHARMAALVTGLRELGADVNYPNPGTNMAYFKLPGWQGDDLARALRERNVLMFHTGRDYLRAVAHLMTTDQDIHDTLTVLAAVRRS